MKTFEICIKMHQLINFLHKVFLFKIAEKLIPMLESHRLQDSEPVERKCFKLSEETL